MKLKKTVKYETEYDGFNISVNEEYIYVSKSEGRSNYEYLPIPRHLFNHLRLVMQEVEISETED